MSSAMRRFVLIVLAGVVLAACSREMDILPRYEEDGFTMTVEAGDPDTKTLVAEDGAGGYAITWQSEDRLAVYEVANGSVQGKSVSDPLGTAGATADFEFNLAGAPSGPYDYTFVSPASALDMLGVHYALTIPQEQTFAAASFDPAADVLVSRPLHLDMRLGAVSASFVRLGGTARMLIKAPATGESVQKIIFSTTATNIAGSYELNLATGEVSEEMLSGVKKLTLTPASATAYNGDFAVWFRLAEVTLNSTFTVSITTSDKNYTKTVNLAAAGRQLEFRNSRLTTFTVDMRSVAGVDVSRTDVITSGFTGITTTSYTSWSGKTGAASGAVYAGHSATRDNGAIGLRTNQTYTGEYSGIVTTTSGGEVKSVTITATSTSSGYSRIVDVYAKKTAYSSSSDLFDTGTAGDYIGCVETAVGGSGTGTVEIPSGYTFVGIRSNGYAVDIPEIRVTWRGGELLPPSVSTGAATDITSAGATIAGSYAGAAGGIYEAGFYWDASSSALANLEHPLQVVTTDGSNATGGNFSCTVTSLNELTTYYYRAYVLWLNTETNTYEEYYGEIRSFQTGTRDFSSAGWLELPAYTTSGMAGTSDSSFSDLYCITHRAEMDGTMQRNYTALYDPEMYASYWVAYPLCSRHMGSGRTDDPWCVDPGIPAAKQVDLSQGGYSVPSASVVNATVADQYYARGHQIPNADRNGEDEMRNQTYYAINSTPQLHKEYNDGIWLELEKAVRSAVIGSDTVYVVTGAAFRKKGGSETIHYVPSNRYGSLPLPNYYWKVLLKVKRSGSSINNAKAIGFWLEHRDDLVSNGYVCTDFVQNVDQIETWTGFDFFANLPQSLQASIETNTDWNSFKTF